MVRCVSVHALQGIPNHTIFILCLDPLFSRVFADVRVLQIVDPWGTILAQCNDVFHEEPTFCLANIDLKSLGEIRTRMPVDEQRRPDIYPTL